MAEAELQGFSWVLLFYNALCTAMAGILPLKQVQASRQMLRIKADFIASNSLL